MLSISEILFKGIIVKRPVLPRCKSYSAKTCHDFSKLTQVQTLAFPDETSIPPGQNKRTQVREVAQEKVFPEARNFK